jgi:hypothetical protein
MSRYDRPNHRVFMTFFYRKGWQVQFLEADARTPVPRALTFTDPEKIRELAKRGLGQSGEQASLGERYSGGQRRMLLAAYPGAVCSAQATLTHLEAVSAVSVST